VQGDVLQDLRGRQARLGWWGAELGWTGAQPDPLKHRPIHLLPLCSSPSWVLRSPIDTPPTPNIWDTQLYILISVKACDFLMAHQSAWLKKFVSFHCLLHLCVSVWSLHFPLYSLSPFLCPRWGYLTEAGALVFHMPLQKEHGRNRWDVGNTKCWSGKGITPLNTVEI